MGVVSCLGGVELEGGNGAADGEMVVRIDLEGYGNATTKSVVQGLVDDDVRLEASLDTVQVLVIVLG